MTALADDLRDYIAVPTPIEEIPDGAEVDLGTGWLERVLDTETAAEREHGDHGDLVHVVILHYEDMNGAPCTYTRPRGSLVIVYVPYRSAPDGPRPRCRTVHEAWVAGWEDAAALPAPSDAVLGRLALLWAPYLRPVANQEAA
ncbi:MAG: hypothetical protein J2P19_32815 [Pseudonocardia sp.]|nr:hypothetical protein [Pseudonocardia sp.]